MAGEWRDVLLDELADEITVGHVGSMASEYVSEGIPFLRSQNVEPFRVNDSDLKFISPAFHERLRKSNLSPGDVVIVRTGKPGACAVIPNSLSIANCSDLVIVRCGPMLDQQFLSYYVNSVAAHHVDSHLVGAVQQHFNVGSARTLVIHLPDISEQRAIAHILGTLDDKIELNRKMNETLEAIARALFNSWFVDFDPVRAKAEGRDTGLPKPIADLFPDSFEDSELGEIPKGWMTSSIYAIADVVYGAPFASAQFNTECVGSPLIRIRDLADENPGVWTPEVHPKGYKVRPGDIVVGMDGEFRAYLWGGKEAWLNQRVCVFNPKRGISAAFVRNSITDLLAQVEATETATTVIHLGKSDIDRFLVVVPTHPVLAAFNHACQPWYDRIVAAKCESRTLIALRDTLLPKLISGDLRIDRAMSLVGGGRTT